MKGKYLRGEIYLAELDKGIGSEQKGRRPVMIIQNNVGNKHSPTVVVAAITSRMGKHNLPTHVRLSSSNLAKDSMVMLEQIRTIDKRRLKEYICKATAEEMELIDGALLISIGMDRREEDAI